METKELQQQGSIGSWPQVTAGAENQAAVSQSASGSEASAAESFMNMFQNLFKNGLTGQRLLGVVGSVPAAASPQEIKPVRETAPSAPRVDTESAPKKEFVEQKADASDEEATPESRKEQVCVQSERVEAQEIEIQSVVHEEVEVVLPVEDVSSFVEIEAISEVEAPSLVAPSAELKTNLENIPAAPVTQPTQPVAVVEEALQAQSATGGAQEDARKALGQNRPPVVQVNRELGGNAKVDQKIDEAGSTSTAINAAPVEVTSPLQGNQSVSANPVVGITQAGQLAESVIRQAVTSRDASDSQQLHAAGNAASKQSALMGEKAQGAGSMKDVKFNQNELVERIQKMLEEAAKAKNGSTLSFRLDPPELGALTVKVTQRADQLFARISPENPEVENVLRTRMQDLIRILAVSGIRADNVHVSIGAEVVDVAPHHFEGFFADHGQGSSNPGEQEGHAGKDAPSNQGIVPSSAMQKQAIDALAGWVA